MAIRRTCQHCGADFEAQKVSARFCSATHRVAWNRQQKKPGATVVPLRRAPAQALTVAGNETLNIEAHVRRELGETAATALGQMCLTAARRIDSAEVAGSALATVMKRLDDMLEKAVAAGAVAEVEADETNPITFLQRRAEGRARDAG